MKDCFGQHGWREFLTNRNEILSEYDRLVEKTLNRPVHVTHGTGVEAYLRKWFTEFLPKKYGVTSGYIIPNIYDDSMKLYHYDIIVYDQLNSPILWTEGSEDDSDQGKHRAIPAEHVLQVYEVKSRFTKKAIVDAKEKLRQPNVYKAHLPELYRCGVIFVELKEKDNRNKKIVKTLLEGDDIHGFIGGVVLRYEGDSTCTGLIQMLPHSKDANTEANSCIPIAKCINDLNIEIDECGSLVIAEPGGGAKMVKNDVNSPYLVAKLYGVEFSNGRSMVSLNWARSHFADFCINILTMLAGQEKRLANTPIFGQVFELRLTQKK